MRVERQFCLARSVLVTGFVLFKINSITLAQYDLPPQDDPSQQQHTFRRPKVVQHFRVEDALFGRTQPNLQPISGSSTWLLQEPLQQAGKIQQVPTASAANSFSRRQDSETDVVARSKSIASQGGSLAAAGENCQPARRGPLRRLYEEAKNMLTFTLGSPERRSLGGNLMVFGSSLLAAAVPLAALLVPDFSALWRRSAHSLANSTSAATSAGSLYGQLDSAMSWIERSVERLPNFPRLHPQECVKRSICEAHNDPSAYGLLGLTLRLLFPARRLASTDRMDDMEFKVINKYRHAAGFGASKRTENNGTGSPGVCREKYEDCLVNLLDVSKSLLEVFLK